MIHKALLFLLALFPTLIYSQTATVSGTIKDAGTKEGIIGATIFIDAKASGGSDVSGKYSVKVEPGKHTLTIKSLGYKEQSKQFDVIADEKLTLDFQMVSSSKELDIVVVSAGKYEQKIGDVTVSVEVIKPALVENKNTTNLETIVDQTPGVTVMDGQANIRGGSGYSYGAGSRVLMLVDELPMISGDAGDVKWNFLPVENVEQIEVIKGASSALFGSSALNGVINLRTIYPRDTPMTTISATSGFYDEPRRHELIWWGTKNPTFSGMNFSHARKIGNLDMVLGGHIFNDDGYRAMETELRGRFNCNLRYRFKKVPGLNAGVNLNTMRTAGGLFILWEDGDTAAYEPKGGSVQQYLNTRTAVDPYLTYTDSSGNKLSVRTRFFRTNNRNDLKQGSLADLYYGELQYQRHWKNHLTLTTGYVITHASIIADLYNNHSTLNHAVYLQADKKFFDRLTLSLGLRGEYFKLDTSNTEFDFIHGKDTTKLPVRPVMRAGANVQVFEATWVRASFGQGYRFPCVAEKYIRTSASGLEIYPNDSLREETGWSAEIGIKQGLKFGKWLGYLDISAFRMEYRDMMEFTFGQWGNPLVDPLFGLGFKSVNVGHTRIDGIDISLVGQGKIGPIGVDALAGYTYMNPISLDFDPAHDTLFNTSKENILKYRYKHIAKADVQLNYKKWSFGVSMRYNSFMENLDKFFYSAGYLVGGIKEYRERFHTGDIVFDHRISYQVNDMFRVALVTNNVFNREYTSRPADVQAPRNFAVQLVVKF